MKKILISLLSIIFIISMITEVYAVTGNITWETSSPNVIIGKTFTVTLAATADSNITGFQAGLSYDKSKLSIENKAVGQGYFDASGSNEIAVGSNSSENLSKSATLYTITFKVLDTSEEGETKINLTNAILALVDGQTDPTNREVTINIKKDDTTVGNQGGTNEDTETPEDGDGTGAGTQTPEDDGNTPSNDDNNNGGNADGNNSNSGNENKNTNKNVNSNKNTNKNTTKLPQTGAESASVIAIITLGTIAIASYVSYRRYKNI